MSRIVNINKPNSIVLDVTGTVATKSFMTYSNESKEFLLKHLRDYVLETWNRTTLRLAINFFRSELTDLKLPPDCPQLADIKAPKEKQAEAFIAHVRYRIEKDWNQRSASIGIFHLGMTQWAYKKGFLKTPVYSEVREVLTRWKKEDGIKLYITLGSAKFLRAVFSRTTDGNLLPLVDGHMNLMENNVKNFAKLPTLLSCNPGNILFLTRIPADAKLAKRQKIPVVIIVRPDFDPEALALIAGLDKKGGLPKPGDSAETNSGKMSNSSNIKPLASAKDSTISTKYKKNTESSVVSDVETLQSVYDNKSDKLQGSKVTEEDIKTFPIILNLKDLKWKNSTNDTKKSFIENKGAPKSKIK